MAILEISAGPIAVRVETLETETARAILAQVPFTSTANNWGDEIYFGTPVRVDQEEDARDVMETGDIAYWPPGNAIAICFGPTPVSRGDEKRLASPGNVWARALDDLGLLRQVSAGDPVSVTRLK